MDPRSRLVALAGTADARSLAEGAFWIAAEAHPDLDVQHWLGRLDALGHRASERLTSEMDVDRAASAVARFLFEEEGFRGNTEDYYDPRNSFLNDVLDRRLGIPITLSVVYVAVAARAGLDAAGVGLPGHFVVRAERRGRHRLLDPFHGGDAARPCRLRGPGRADAARRRPARPALAGAGHDAADLRPHAQQPEGGVLGARGLAARPGRRGPHPPPRRPTRWRSSATAARSTLGSARDAAAVRDWETYLRRAPAAADAGVVRDRLRALRQALASRN